MSPRVILGKCSVFCASEPYFSSAGPSIQMPKLSSGERALMARISSRSTLASAPDKPPPPYCIGHSGAVQPRAAMRSNHRRWASLAKVKVRPPQQTSSSVSGGRRMSGGQLASSQARVSVRNVSSASVTWSSSFSWA